MVQLPEVCDEGSEAAKAGYKNICEIGKERIRRAGKKIREELAAKNAEKTKDSAPDLFRQDLQDLQDFGGGDNPVNSVNPVKKIYESAPLIACLDQKAKLDNEFFIELAKLKPEIVFFRDDAFTTDSARINVERIFRQNSANTVIKVI